MPLGGISLNRRAIGLILAVVLATIATIAIVSYVQGVRNEAEEATAPVEVFVAKQQIEAGTSAEQAVQTGFIGKESRARADIPAGVITTLDEIQGRFASQTIFAGSEIVSGMFVESVTQIGGGSTLRIPENRMAISVDVPLVPAVAGYIQPGDNISILVQVAQAAREPRVRFMLQDVEVLAVGQRGSVVPPAPGQPATAPPPSGLLTLSVTGRQAEQIAFVAMNAKMYLTLLPDGARPVRTRGRTATNLFGR